MQSGKLYIGNLSQSVTQDELTELFSNYGEVQHVRLIMFEGRGFGFVEMSQQLEADKAREALKNSDFRGRPLRFYETYLPKRG